MPTKTETALIILLNHVTTGIQKDRNPYSIPAVKYAIRVLQEEGACPVGWHDIYNKLSATYYDEAIKEEEAARKALE